MKIFRVAFFVLLSSCASQSNYRHSGDFSVYEYTPSKWHIQYKAEKTTPQAMADKSLANKASQLCPGGYNLLPEFDYIEVTSSTPSKSRVLSKPSKAKWFSVWVRCS
jgi:hypothetical protein